MRRRGHGPTLPFGRRALGAARVVGGRPLGLCLLPAARRGRGVLERPDMSRRRRGLRLTAAGESLSSGEGRGPLAIAAGRARRPSAPWPALCVCDAVCVGRKIVWVLPQNPGIAGRNSPGFFRIKHKNFRQFRYAKYFSFFEGKIAPIPCAAKVLRMDFLTILTLIFVGASAVCVVIDMWRRVPLGVWAFLAGLGAVVVIVGRGRP